MQQSEKPLKCKNKYIYIIKEFVQPKMSFNSREFLIWKERGRGYERERERQPGRSAGRHI
jgi:hypothetical protein